MNLSKTDASANHKSAADAVAVCDLIDYIKQNPRYAPLVERAKNPSKQPERPGKLRKVSEGVRALVVAAPEDFHGRAMVSKELAKDCRRTATLVSVSSAVNASTSFPLLYYAFRDLGGIGPLVALSVSVLLLKFTNASAAAASARKSHGRFWSNWAIASVLSVNALLSLVAGVGTELILNQTGLSERKAGEAIQTAIARVEELKRIDSPQYADALARCEKGEAELGRLDKTHPRWASLYVQLYGIWARRDTDWGNVPLEQLPLCRQVERLRREAYQNYETAKGELERSLAVRATMGDDLAFLKREMPPVYGRHFTPEGELRSGVEATRLAILNFATKLRRGNWAGLGFHLFALLVSVLTSGPACAMTVALSLRRDTRKSFSSAVELQRDLWLEARRRELGHGDSDD